MKKFSIIAVAAALAFAASPLMAGDKDGHCAKNASNETKASCSMSFASLDLKADQKVQLEAAKADLDKAGCTKETQTAFMTKAENILSKEQYAKLKAECEKGCAKKEHTQS